MAPTAGRGDEPAAAAPHRHRHRFVSDDLNVRVQGRILEQKEPGRIDGIRLELDSPVESDAADDEDPRDAITVLYPQLVSIHTRPESQTLVSINTGERLLTLDTPLISDDDDDEDEEEEDPDDVEGDDGENALDDDDGDVSDIEGGEQHKGSRAQKPTQTRQQKEQKKRKRPIVITLHEGFLPASEAAQLEESSLYSTTFRIVIDGPSYPLPHFDPAVLAPPTPAVRPHGTNDATTSAAYGGVLNSPTLQRALLSPLLSPQRRAASQGSDMSVPPLSLGLSRASRPSFTSAERPHFDSSVPLAGQKRRPTPVTLMTLIPSLAPPKSTAAFSTSSTTPQVGPTSIHQHYHGGGGGGGGGGSSGNNRQTPAPVVTLAGTLTSALSTAAKHTAEEILALRRAHDAYQRRAKAELEVLEARIENARSEAGIAVAVGGTEAVVRGFKTREEKEREREERIASVSRSRERGRSPADHNGRGGTARHGRGHSRDADGSGGRSVERTPASPSSAVVRPALGSTSTSSSSVVPNRDEAASALIRAQDEREEDERGRSRSRSRRTGGLPASATGTLGRGVSTGSGAAAGSSSSRGRPGAAVTATASAAASSSASSHSSSNTNAPVGSQRSRSRTKAVAEATLRAVEAAKERQGAPATGAGSPGGSLSPRMGHGPRPDALAPPPPGVSGSDPSGERRARSPLSRESESVPTSPDAAADQPGRSASASAPADTGDDRSGAANVSSPSGTSSGSQPLPPVPRLQPPPATATAGSTTPAFAPSSHVLGAIPETDETSIPLERTHSGGLSLDVPNEAPAAVPVARDPEEESDPPFEMDEDVDVQDRDFAASSARSRQSAPALDSPSLARDEAPPLPASHSPRAAASAEQQQIPVSSSFKPGSFQRASALSASYNALLASTKSAPSRPVVQPVSPSVNATTRTPFTSDELVLSEDQLPPFSPPDARSYMSASVREDVQTALLASTLERTELARRTDGDGVSSRGSSSAGGAKSSAYVGPDPRDVRRGEQKIRDVLAMDVPSHRPRGGAGARQEDSMPGRGFDEDEDDDDDEEEEDAPSSEEDDTVEELASPVNASRSVGMAAANAAPDDSTNESMPVGSVPIALGRPSTVNAALSSWRPDPERLWAQQRRERKTSGPVPPLHSPGLADGPPPIRAAQSPQLIAGGKAILVPSSSTNPGSEEKNASSPTQPVEIGSPTIPRPADVGGGQGGSSLARSLRAQQGIGTFVQLTGSGTTAHRRSGGEGTGSAPGPNGRDPFENERRPADRGEDSDGDNGGDRNGMDHRSDTDENGNLEEGKKEASSDDDDDDDDDEFVPPHLVKGRRDREDEEWLSRSVPQS
ncbi:hypothetical protein JCM3774_006238 [Rhodotorula dairenensis]